MSESIANVAGNFVFDMDEVLVDISPIMYSTIRFHWRKYSKWFKDLGPLTPKEVHNRNLFLIDEWLLKEEIKALPEAELKELRKKIFKNLLFDFFNTDFYSYLKPTEFAKRTIMNPLFMDNMRVNKVYILTRYIPAAKNMVGFKKAFLEKWFNHPKVENIFIPSGKKKSDALKENNVVWNLFADDELKNIIDFIQNTDINGKEFLIPKFGYNKIDPLTDLVIKEKGGAYSYY